jgi:DNA-binding IclR family transcriptional regulator
VGRLPPPPHDQSPADGETIDAGKPARTSLPNRAAARGLCALQLLVFHPTSAPGLARAMRLDDRTARRLLFALEDEGYLQRGPGAGRRRHLYSPTPKLLALAAQLAARLPLMTRGHQVVGDLHKQTRLDAFLVIPSYGHVVVLASSGDRAPAPWSLLPANDSAGGRVLLAYRDSWRDDQRPHHESRQRQDLEALATEIRRRGYAVHDDDARSLAVPVPMIPVPLAAVVVAGPRRALAGSQRETVLASLRGAAARLGDSDGWRRATAAAHHTASTLRITAKARDQGLIRVPNAAKRMFPAGKANILVRLRGATVRAARWNPRYERPERSGTLYVGRHTLNQLVNDDEMLAITIDADGHIQLT